MVYNNCFILYVLCSYWIGFYGTVEGTPCNTNQKLGVGDTAPAPGTAGTSAGTSYLLTGTNMVINCCGVIKQWTFGAKVTGDMTAQVWEPVAGSTYKVVGENTATGVAPDTELHMVIGTSEQISVKANDVIGWHSSGVEIPGYITDGGANMGVRTNGGKTAVGGSVTWPAASDNGVRWLVEIELGPGTAPSFDGTWPQTANAAVSDPVPTKVLDLIPTDVNTGDIPNLTVTIVTGGDKFELDGNKVNTKTTLTPGNHVVVFEVKDACDLSASATLTVSVTDTGPIITSLPFGKDLREDTKLSTSIHDIIVTDIDTDLTDVNCRIDSTDPTPAPFTMKIPEKRVEYVHTTDPAIKLDYTTKPLYTLNIICNDGTSDSAVGILQVTIIPNDEPVPTINTIVVDASDQTLPVPSVGEVTATDTENDPLTFTMSNCSCPFRMTPDGKVYATENLNSHRIPLYTVNVTVEDEYNTVGPTPMTIQIININTPPTLDNPTKVLPEVDAVSLDEHTDEGTPNAMNTIITVFTAAASDDDAGDTITYEMNFKNGKGAKLYEFDSATGIITTKAGVNLNYEELTVQDLVDTFVEIRAFDGREYSEWREMKISVNDINETPEIDGQLYAIETNESASSLACPYFSTTDEDRYDTEQYTLGCGTIGIFQVESNAITCGAILKQISEYDLDSPGRAKEVITCTVTVKDKGDLSATSTLKITVHEEDDNPPIFDPTSYTYTITNATTPGAVFGDVDATDADFLAEHKRITYSTQDNDFGVDANGGIYSKTDWTTQSVPRTKTFTVTARDAAGHTDTAEVTVHVVEAPTTTTTTTQATTLPANYQDINSFLDDPGNLAWLIPAILLGLAALGLSIFMCFRCCSPGACANMCKGGSLFRTGRTGRGRIAGRNVKRVREPVRRTITVREKREPIRVIEREAPQRDVFRENPAKEPKKDSSMFDCFKSKPKDKPPPATESWDFWNSGGF